MPTEKWRRENQDKVKASRKRWYEKNKASEIKRIEARKKDIREWFAEYKAALCCTECSEDVICCLDFHHLDPDEKELDVAILVHNGCGKDRILEEIAKCKVVCANCHRKIHAGLI
jgi:hypothetical protein